MSSTLFCCPQTSSAVSLLSLLHKCFLAFLFVIVARDFVKNHQELWSDCFVSLKILGREINLISLCCVLSDGRSCQHLDFYSSVSDRMCAFCWVLELWDRYKWGFRAWCLEAIRTLHIHGPLGVRLDLLTLIALWTCHIHRPLVLPLDMLALTALYDLIIGQLVYHFFGISSACTWTQPGQ